MQALIGFDRILKIIFAEIIMLIGRLPLYILVSGQKCYAWALPGKRNSGLPLLNMNETPVDHFSL